MSTQSKHCPEISEVMMTADQFPVVRERDILKSALDEMDRKKLGVACVVDADQRLLGLLTDGDLRRKLLTVQKPLSALFLDDVIEHSIRRPVTILVDETLIEGLEKMEANEIWDLPVVSSTGRLMGLLHLHPVVRALVKV